MYNIWEISVWDIRREKPVMSFKSMEDFVSDMITTDAKKFLVCSSGDGTITSFNIPARKMFVQVLNIYYHILS